MKHIASQQNTCMALLVVTILILLTGALCFVLKVDAFEQLMRKDLLWQAQIVAESIKADRVQMLSGSEKDLEAPYYRRLKSQLAAFEKSDPKVRHVALLGKKPNGQVFFFMDSEDAGSSGYSQPGQILQAPESCLRVFETRTGVVENPLTDKRGTWITVFVPLMVQTRSEPVAVLAIAVDAHEWRGKAMSAAAPVFGFAALLIVVISCGALLISRRETHPGLKFGWMRHLEVGLTIAIGLIVSGYITWVVVLKEQRNRTESFYSLGISKTASVSKAILDVVLNQLEGLASYYIGSNEIRTDEFAQYTGYLTKSALVQTWEWIDAVPASEREPFENDAERIGKKGVKIWEQDKGGHRVSVSEREIYFPITRVAPLAGNEEYLGFDSGSDPVRRKTIAEAAAVGLATASEPVVPAPGQKGLLILRPVYDRSHPARLRGFAGAMLRLETILESAHPDKTAYIDFSLLRPDGTSDVLASTHPEKVSTISVSQPILAMGKVFVVTAHAGPGFERIYPSQNGWRTAMLGTVITLAFAAILHVIFRKREELEHLVAERTSALRESEEKHRALFEKNHSIQLLIDPANGRIVDANSAACKFYGYTREQMSRMNITDINTLPREDVIREMRMAMAEKRPYFNFRHRRASGVVSDVESYAGPIQPEGKELLYSIIHDISERKQAETELRMLADVIERSPVSVLITDLDGIIQYVNPYFTELTGYTSEEACGQSTKFLQSGLTPPERFRSLWQTVSEGKIWRGEIINRKKSGEIYIEAAIISMVNDLEGNPSRYVAIKQDITDQKRAEEELCKAKEAAEAANQAKSAFLANMSHEIRTPMNAILGFAQLLLRDPSATSEQKKQLEIINRSGGFLLSLINDILEMSKIEAGHVTLAPVRFDLHGLLKDLEGVFQTQIQSQHLQFAVETAGEMPQWVIGDERKLRQVLFNLLGNAVKFTRAGWIALRVSVDNRNGDAFWLAVEIEDTGDGIAAEEQKALFTRFTQTHSGRQSGGGTGLGLAITRQFIQIMGGEISVRSEPGKGSLFRFRLPMRRTAFDSRLPAASAAVYRLGPAQSPCRILIVDDNGENLLLLEQMLVPAGFEISRASDGFEVLKQGKRMRPHLVLIDLTTPGMDGCETIRRLRAEKETEAVKIIVNSASAFEEDRQRALEAGADAFLSKPIEYSELFRTLRKLLGQEFAIEEVVPALAAEGIASTTAISAEGLSCSWLTEMRQAVVAADFDTAASLIDQIAPLDAARAKQLRRWVEQFEAKALLRFLDQEPRATTHE